MNAKFPHGHKALNINGMIQKEYQDLDTYFLPSNCPPLLPGTAKCNPSKTKTAVMLAAKKRKISTASENFELIHAHDPGSFLQQLTLNTKCLQIALFLMDFIFASTDLLATSKARIKLYFLCSLLAIHHASLWSCAMACSKIP
jgi:hypothetical protein